MKKVDDMSIEELTSSITELKQNKTQIESILEIEKDDEYKVEVKQKNKELQSLLHNVSNAIVFYEEALNFKLQAELFNDSFIDDKAIGKVASVYYETEHTWNNAIIDSIDNVNGNENDNDCGNIKEQLINITFLGYKDSIKVPYKYVKLNKELSDDELVKGTICDCIYMEDGKWYQATIEEIIPKGVQVKYNNYNNQEIVSRECIRITPEQKIINWKNKPKENGKGNQDKNNSDKKKDIFAPFVIPAKLKISPADTDEQRLLKRKRVKNLKHKNKQEIIEHISKEKQKNWLSFNKQLTENKSVGFTPMRTLPSKK